MRSDKKTPLKSDKKPPSKIQKKGTLGYNKKSALLEDAITQMNAGKYGRASAALKDLLALDPLNAEARRLFATLHLRLGSLMSARTAFESLAREAMERQDYWLAESLLREYLTAGPRCVPFLEMLGHVYEDKGDVMAAVAEYGKALEVLLEDPDSDHPNHASELFGKIRSIAPGSPVAFRFAAMFDTVTGQIVPTLPQSGATDTASEPVPATPISESLVQPAAASTMPWEQMEPTPTDQAVAAEAEAATTDEPADKDVRVSLASVESATETLVPAKTSDSVSAMHKVDFPLSANVHQLGQESSSLSHALQIDPDQVASRNEETLIDSVPPAPSIAADQRSVIGVLREESNQPITEKSLSPVSMPWDQDDAPALSPMVAGKLEAADGGTTPAAEAGLPSPLLAEVQATTIQVTEDSSHRSLTEGPAGPDSLPCAEDMLPAASAETDSPAATETERNGLITEAEDLPALSMLGSTSRTIEVLRTSSAHPIAESPVSPASMPWDQVEEMTGAFTAEQESVEKVEATPTGAGTSPMLDADAVAESPAAPVSSFTSSLGLSWEDILAAVTAMQSSPACPPAEPVTEDEATPDPVVPDKVDLTDTPHQESAETDWFKAAPVPSDMFASLTDSPSLSAPMPWEQIEVGDLAILRPDPEPEFGPVLGGAVGGSQDSTVVLPAAEDTRDPDPVLPLPGTEVVRDGLSHSGSPSMPDFQILSTDALGETFKQPQPIHIPPEAFELVEPAEESGLVAVSEPAPSEKSTLDLPGTDSIGLLSNEPESPGEGLKAPAAESPAEGVGAASGEMSQASDQLVVEAIEDPPLIESTGAVLLYTSSPVDRPLTALADQEPAELDTPEPLAEAAVTSVELAFVADQPVLQAESITVVSEVVPAAKDAEPVSEPEPSTLSEQGLAAISEMAGSEAAIPMSNGSDVPAERVSGEPASQALEGHPDQSVTAPDIFRSDELNLPALEPGPVAEAAVATADSVVLAAGYPDTQASVPTAVPEVSAGLHILWDDSSSKPIPSASIGNMLTRWLKRPADVAPAEASPAAAITGESGSPLAPTPVEPQEALASLADRPIDRSVEVTPPLSEQYATRPKPSKPIMGQTWRRMGRAATSLIGAGISTTRSLVVLVVALLSLMAAMLAGWVGVIALTWLILEEQPTPAYRTMTAVPQHTLEDSQKNGYFFLLGFAAPPTQDPVQTGIDRRAEEADRAVTLSCLTRAGHGSDGPQGASAEVAGKWLKSSDPAAQMRAEAAGVKSWVSQAGVAMGRYRQWLSKPFEDWGYGQPVSPHCGVILYAHRLYVAEGFAQDVEAGVARVETDLTAWRTVLGQAKTMPVKMLAADTLNDDIAVVSGLLVRPDLDDRLISRLAKLARPLDQAEQSIRWPMQSQFVVATKTLDEAMNHDPADARPFYGSVAAALPLPKQRRFNAYAEYYEAVGKAAAEGRYADLPKQSQFVRTPPYGLVDVVVNPIESLVGIEPLPTWETFAGRVLETDARLRLASLQAWLRRNPPEQDLLTRVARAGQGLYDPFTGYPMLVNMKKGVFYSVGRDMKDNDAQDRFDVVVPIPPTAWAGGKRPADPTGSK